MENYGFVEIVVYLLLVIVGICITKYLIGWYHEIPKRNQLLEEIRDELKKLNEKNN